MAAADLKVGGVRVSRARRPTLALGRRSYGGSEGRILPEGLSAAAAATNGVARRSKSEDGAPSGGVRLVSKASTQVSSGSGVEGLHYNAFVEAELPGPSLYRGEEWWR